MVKCKIILYGLLYPNRSLKDWTGLASANGLIDGSGRSRPINSGGKYNIYILLYKYYIIINIFFNLGNWGEGGNSPLRPPRSATD